MMRETVLELKNIVKDYSGFKALDGVDFSMSKGEIVAVIGAIGSGKSTMLRCINGLVTITSGRSCPERGNRYGVSAFQFVSAYDMSGKYNLCSDKGQKKKRKMP